MKTTQPTITNVAEHRRTLIIQCLLLVAAIFLLYKPALEYGFVWDDHLYVEQNKAVQSWQHLSKAFTSPLESWSTHAQYNMVAWRPIRNVSYLTDHSLYGLNPTGWHLTNIILHCMAALALMALLRWAARQYTGRADLTTGAAWLCCLLALVWAVHPAQTEVVAWVKSRDDLLATPLLFGALWLLLARPGRWAPLIAVLVMYPLALLSKENAVILPGLYAAAVIYLVARRPNREQWVTFALLVLVSAAFLVLRHVVLGRTTQAGHPGDNMFQTLWTMLHAFAKYVQITMWPWPPTQLLADYDGFPITRTVWHAPSLTGLALLSGITIVALMGLARRGWALVGFACAVYLITLFPFSNIVPMMQIMADRFLYIPIAALPFLILGMSIWRHGKFVYVTAVTTPIAVLALGVATHQRLPVWESDITLFTASHRDNPTSWRPADHLVKAHLKDGNTTAGLTLATRNLSAFPNDTDIVRTAALAHLLAGHVDAGTSLTMLAVQMQPNDPRASTTLQNFHRMQAQKSAGAPNRETSP